MTQAMAQSPNTGLSALPKAQSGRNLRDPHLLWSRSGRVLIAERLRLNTARVVSIRLDEYVLSNTWWTLRVFESERVSIDDVECILTLWLNSTLGIFSLIAARVDTEGAWIEMKKPILKGLAVLDPFALSATQRKQLVRAYHEVSSEHFMRIPDIKNDAVRKKVDVALMNALGVHDDLEILRHMISQEP